MHAHFIEDSDRWKINREKRIVSFVHLSSLIVIFTGLTWLIISVLTGMYLLCALILVVILLGFYALHLVRIRNLRKANMIVLGAAGMYFTLVCLITSGSGLNNFTTHFWFIALSLASYFLLIDEKAIVREGIALTSLSLVFVFHFRLLPSFKLIALPVELHYVVSIIDLATALAVIYLITRLFVLEITKAESALITYSDKLDSLIENLLPKPIAERLKKEGKTFADFYPGCSVLFADIVGFTNWSEQKTPTHVVERLNSVFSNFDEIAASMNLTKIKTIGDAYMVASGIPDFKKDHAMDLLQFAREIHRVAAEYDDLQFRIGIHSGPVVAGIIGKTRIIYDLWGDTVNIASRLEYAATPGETLISETTFELVKSRIHEPVIMRTIPVKGRGAVNVYDLKLL